MDLVDAAVHFASAGSGAVTVSFVARALLKSWMRRHDEMARAVESMGKELVRFSVVIERFEKHEARTLEIDKTLAVVSHRLSQAESYLNGLGSKLHASREDVTDGN